MSDDFSARYRLLKCVLVDDGIRTHNAQEAATGKVVMVHINDAAGPDEVDAMRAQLASLPDGHKNMVLETATLASGFAVVTEFLPGLTSFGGWLGRDKNATGAVGEEASTAMAKATEPPPKPAIRVSFKKPFKAPADVPPSAVLGGAGVSPLAPAAPAAPTPSARVVPAAPALPVMLAAEATPAPSSTSADFHAASADSFTGMFGAPVDPKTLDGGVEFVRSGQPAPAAINFALHSDVKLKTAVPVGEAGMPVPSAPVTPSPVVPPSVPAAAPGEFTMMFSPSVHEAATTPTPFPTPAPARVSAPAPASAPPPARAAAPEATPAAPLGVSSPRPERPPAAPAVPMSDLLAGPPPLETPLAPVSVVATPVPFVAPSTPPPAAPPSPPVPAPSPFGWDTPAVAEAPVSKAPPGEFTMLFGAPATAAPVPDQVRNSPMKEAPPPTFSTLTPEKQLESPPVEPMHRVMSGNPSYGAGINQAGQSPIGNNLGSGGYAGGAQYPPPQQPPPNLNYGGASYPNRQPYQAMPEFAPQPPAPSYPAAHASPMFAQEKQLAGEPGSAPGILPPPIFSSGSSTPLSALGGAAPRISANAGPSEYTQLIANGPAPVVPELKPAKSAAETAKAGKRRLPTGLIIVINAVLLIATLLVFFVFRQQVPNRARLTPAAPIMPNIPTAPRIPR